MTLGFWKYIEVIIFETLRVKTMPWWVLDGFYDDSGNFSS